MRKLKIAQEGYARSFSAGSQMMRPAPELKSPHIEESTDSSGNGPGIFRKKVPNAFLNLQPIENLILSEFNST